LGGKGEYAVGQRAPSWAAAAAKACGLKVGAGAGSVAPVLWSVVWRQRSQAPTAVDVLRWPVLLPRAGVQAVCLGPQLGSAWWGEAAEATELVVEGRGEAKHATRARADSHGFSP
jgi:hypothetical protein